MAPLALRLGGVLPVERAALPDGLSLDASAVEAA